MTRFFNALVVIVMVLLSLVGIGTGLFALLTFSFGSILLSLAAWFTLTLLYLLKHILEELTKLRHLQERQVRLRDKTMVNDPNAAPPIPRERVSA
jgi:hypothetical protein